MKKLFLLIVCASMFSGVLFAQEKRQITIKAGTIVPLQAIQQVKAADVEVGSIVDFRVTNDVTVDGVCAIPRGTIAKGKVTEAKKSSIAGTKGRLTISISNMILQSGEQIYFTGSDVRLYGKNRTPLAVVTCIFVWPCIFIPGSRP